MKERDKNTSKLTRLIDIRHKNVRQDLQFLEAKAMFGPLPIFANKVLLDYSHINLFIYHLRLVSQFKGKVQ